MTIEKKPLGLCSEHHRADDGWVSGGSVVSRWGRALAAHVAILSDLEGMVQRELRGKVHLGRLKSRKEGLVGLS